MIKSGKPKKRMMEDAIAARVITLGGLTILVMLGAIIWHLLRVVLPLIESPQADSQQVWAIPEEHTLITLGDLTHNQFVWLEHECDLVPGYLVGNKIQTNALSAVSMGCDEQFIVHQALSRQYLFRFKKNNQLFIEQLLTTKTKTHREIVREFDIEPEPEAQEYVRSPWIAAVSRNVFAVATKVGKEWVIYGLKGDAKLHTAVQGVLKPDDNRGGNLKRTKIEAEHIVLLPEQKQVVAYQENKMKVYNEEGNVVSIYELDSAIKNISTNQMGRSLFIEMENQQLQKWVINNTDGQFIYVHSVTFDSPVEVLSRVYSPNEQAALLLNRNLELLFTNIVTGEVIDKQILDIPMERELELPESMVVHSDRMYLASDTQIHYFVLSGQSAITTSSLFRRVWYEGYPEADFVWQSTSSNNNTEVKFSLVPLVIGSVKSAVLSIVVAIPLALGAAIYTAYFAPEPIRNSLKPIIEFLEAIPSVVIGFVAAGWMATMTLQTLLSMLVSIVLLPLILWVIAIYQYRLTRKLPRKWQFGSEWLGIIVLLIVVYALVEFVISFWGSGVLLSITHHFDGFYWSKSTLVVALALGIAIVPTIYSIAEDAIYDVPMSLRQASFALGATRIQTLKKVVLVAAAPALLSAVMLGFSRAFGETILVLMITGNTPIADWDLLVGLRSMTANLAIELPEAEVNSIHYRVLFVTALILFVFTFLINTIAEWIRGNVRRRYRYV